MRTKEGKDQVSLGWKEVKPSLSAVQFVVDDFVYRSLELASTRFDRSESRYAMALAIRWDSIAPTCWRMAMTSALLKKGWVPKTQ
jgi:hypothetical protein